MIYGLTKEEKTELDDLNKELFGENKLAVIDEEQSPEKVYRLNYLVKKKQELMLASLQ